MLRPVGLYLTIMLALGWTACTSSVLLEQVDTSPARVAALEARITADSSNVEALRDLGIIFVHQERFEEAVPVLRRAFELDAEDLYTRVYYGLALEHTNRLDAARDLYAHYRELPSHSRFHRWLAGRHETTTRQLVHRDLKARLAQEDSIIAVPLDTETLPNTVAVFPFEFEGNDDRYEPLGRGLSTLILRDLAQVEQLTVLERIRMDVLLDELALGESEAVAPGTAPRVGRLLRARRVIGGRYTVSEEERVRLDVAMHEVVSEETQTVPAEDRLSQFFALEKDLVFDLIDEMDIMLSEAERRAIEFIPTRDLQAFLAYSRGVQAEDAGRFGEASGFFQQALALDPRFSAAAEQAEINEGLEAASVYPGLPPGTEGESLLRKRQQNLVENVGSLILPVEDRRDEGPGGLVPIGRPPAPPDGN